MIALGLLSLPMFNQKVHGHGAVTNPVPRLLDSEPYCAWCVGEHVAANPPGQVEAGHPVSCQLASTTMPPTKTTNFIGCHGKLRIEGVQLVDEHGQVVQLMGMSSHGLHCFPDCYSKESIQYLVEHCYSCAIPFFEDMARSYKDEKHVLFEICNEPNGVDGSTVKMYADSVISAIRQIDGNTVIIVGTPTWSQDIHEARADPVSMPSNVMYAFHFYAGTHMSLMTRVQDEAKLIPIFASEWGTSQASGDGGPYLEDAKSFLDLFNDASGQKISWVQWSYADKNETSAALASGVCASQAWGDTACRVHS